MSQLTINLPEEQIEQIQEIAQKLGLSTEKLLEIKINDWLTETKPYFSQAANYILKKNSELYKRLKSKK
ncbi:MAG: ribbon-helix-helix protein, CopG family [Prochloraceae cyanobacterium]|nr:ribbon-helix-helix protein, CopG family [Prochloraceae cyanobacterium]